MAADPQAPSRSEDEIFHGSVTVVLGGVSKSMRPLVARRNAEWKALLADRTQGKLGQISAGSGDWRALVEILAGATALQLELIAAYDHEGRLGGTEWILDNASEREIWEAFKRVFFEAFPVFDDARRFPGIVGELLTHLPQALDSFATLPSASGDGASSPSKTSTRKSS